eukprot:g1812.t1
MRRAFRKAKDSFKSIFKKKNEEEVQEEASGASKSHEPDALNTYEGPEIDLNIVVCSWNVGNKDPKTFSPLVPSNGGDADIVAVGLQESTYGVSVDGNRKETLKLLQESLGSDYELVEALHLMQMKLYVFVKGELHKHVLKKERFVEATGIGGVVGNKGGLCLAFEIFRTKIAFVSAHLAAHREHTEHRNENTRDIIRSITSKRRTLDKMSGGILGENTHKRVKKIVSKKSGLMKKKKRRESKISEHDVGANPLSKYDHLIWMGDLNYRIDPAAFMSKSLRVSLAKECNIDAKKEADLARKEKWFAELKEDAAEKKLEAVMNDWLPVHALVKRKDWSTLLKMDQLERGVESGEVFHGWNLLKPSWPPTFKVLRDSSGGFLHQRVSSYCDRVLYISRPHLKGRLKASSFTSVQAHTTSDHKPVRATFTLRSNAKLPENATLGSSETGQKESELRRRTSSAKNVVNAFSSLDTVVSRFILRIRHVSVKNLQPMDMNGKCDPYVVFFVLPEAICEGVKIKTPVRSKTLSAAWEEIFTIPLHIDSPSDLRSMSLVARVKDMDIMTTNQACGTVIMPLEKVASSKSLEIRDARLAKYFRRRTGSISFDLDIVDTANPSDASSVDVSTVSASSTTRPASEATKSATEGDGDVDVDIF